MIPQAGIDLITRMRDNGIPVPVYVYCSKAAVDLYGDKVRAAGAAGVTSSPLELFEQLQVGGRSDVETSVPGPGSQPDSP